MPTPKGTGAPLAPINIVAPGRFGLNKQNEAALLGPEWATEAVNAVFDASGRLAARKGWLPATTTPMTGNPVISVMHTYLRENGTSTLISTGGNKIWSGVTVPANVTGTATVTFGDNWQFVNFNDACIGVQQGEVPIRSSGGNFADIAVTSGSIPQGNCALAAFGRLWIADSDYQTIKYSGLLDHADWGGPGAGAIDMTSVWPNGMDQVVALAAYNGSLVIFGKNCIVFYTDGQGSALGIDPTQMFVSDTLSGVGCIARDSVQQIDNGDILFLGASGVYSLGRLIQERSNPLNNVSANVRDYLAGFLTNEQPTEIRSIYADREGFYLLILPASKVAFCFDTRIKLPDGTLRVTEWTTGLKAGTCTQDGSVYLSLSHLGGRIGLYTGYNDRNSSNTAVSYNLVYHSGWLDLGGESELSAYIKILKTITGTAYSGTAGNTMSLVWGWDFNSNTDSATFTFTNTAGPGEWGRGEWGVMEWGGGASLHPFNVPGRGAGQFLKIGLVVPIDQRTFSLQQINLYAKIGRLAH